MTSSAAEHLSEVRRCEGCGLSLQGKSGQRHCSAKCRARAHRARKAERVSAILKTLKDGVFELEQLIGEPE